MSVDRFSRSNSAPTSRSTRGSSITSSRLGTTARSTTPATGSRASSTSLGRPIDTSLFRRSSPTTTTATRGAPVDRGATDRARSVSGAEQQRSNTLSRNPATRDAIRDALSRPPAEHAPETLGDKHYDDYDDHDWDDHWDDYWDDHHHHGHHGHDWWWHAFTPFHFFPYYHHHFFGFNYPYYNSHWGYHFNFGYYPMYHYDVYPYYVNYQPVYVPSYSNAVVYQPVYIEPSSIDAGPVTTVNEVPPYLADELTSLASNESAMTWLESGAREFKSRSYPAAADAFRRAMLLEAGNAVPKFALAHALFALGDYTNAAFMIRRAMQILPEWPSVGTSLHELYGNEGDLAEHTIALRVFLDASPADGDARFLLAYVSYFSGDLDAAEAAFATVAASNPASVETQQFVARIAEIRATLPADVVEVPTPIVPTEGG